MKPPSTQKQQRLVDWFNRNAGIGSTVNVRIDSGEIKTTQTRSKAEMLGGHTAVVWLVGIAGAYALDRVVTIFGEAGEIKVKSK